jgi:hypothetical protein
LFEGVLREVLTRWQSWNSCKAFLFEVLAQPLPAPGGIIEVSAVSWREPGVIDNLVFTRPSATDALFDYVNFEPMLRECDAECIIALFSSLLVERRVVFTSDSLESLSAVVNAALALLRPLQWQYIFIPLLPATMISFCSSPIPFVVGLLNSSLEDLRKEPHESLVLLDIDNGEFLTDTPDTELIPPVEREKLLSAVKLAKQKLKRNKHLTTGDARVLCDSFLVFFTTQLSGWRSFYADNKFRLDEFAGQRADAAHRHLVASMCASQMFTQYAAKYSATDDAEALSSADGFVSALEQANSDVTSGEQSKPSRRQQLWRLRRLVRRADGESLFGGDDDDAPGGAAAPPAAEEIVFKQGWLNRLSGKRKGKWERRWFKLTADKLAWYKTRSDTKEAGSILLATVTYITDRYSGHAGKDHCVELVTRECAHYIYADSLDELAEWYPHVQMLCVNSTTFQEPDERNALALASSLSLVPTEVVRDLDAAVSLPSSLSSSQQLQLQQQQQSPPFNSLKRDSDSNSSKFSSFLRRKASGAPQPPPNPFSTKARGSSHGTATSQGIAVLAAQAAAATATPPQATPPVAPAATSTAAPTTATTINTTTTTTTATATTPTHSIRFGAHRMRPLPLESAAAQQPAQQQQPPPRPPPRQQQQPSTTAAAVQQPQQQPEQNEDDDSSDLTYSHTSESESADDDADDADDDDDESGSDERLPVLPTVTSALASSASLTMTRSPPRAGPPPRMPPVPNAPPPVIVGRAGSARSAMSSPTTTRRSFSVDVESLQSLDLAGVRRDSSPPPDPASPNPLIMMSFELRAPADASTVNPLAKSSGPPRRPPPLPLSSPPLPLSSPPLITRSANAALPAAPNQ